MSIPTKIIAPIEIKYGNYSDFQTYEANPHIKSELVWISDLNKLGAVTTSSKYIISGIDNEYYSIVGYDSSSIGKGLELQYAISESITSKKSILLLPGEYKLTSTIDLTGSIHLTGLSDMYNTIIIGSGSYGDTFKLLGATTITASNVGFSCQLSTTSSYFNASGGVLTFVGNTCNFTKTSNRMFSGSINLYIKNCNIFSGETNAWDDRSTVPTLRIHSDGCTIGRTNTHTFGNITGINLDSRSKFYNSITPVFFVNISGSNSNFIYYNNCHILGSGNIRIGVLDSHSENKTIVFKNCSTGTLFTDRSLVDSGLSPAIQSNVSFIDHKGPLNLAFMTTSSICYFDNCPSVTFSSAFINSVINATASLISKNSTFNFSNNLSSLSSHMEGKSIGAFYNCFISSSNFGQTSNVTCSMYAVGCAFTTSSNSLNITGSNNIFGIILPNIGYF